MSDMRFIRVFVVAAICGLVCLPQHTLAAAKPAKKPAASTKTSPSSATTHKKRSKGKAKKTSKKRGQKAIESERAEQIQEALIREHYLQGSPSGKWDDATQAAMRRYQADQGWQNKTVPDSRALIKLGLGPSTDHLLNPETAMTTVPAAQKPPAKSEPAGMTSHPATDPATPAPQR